MQRRNFIHNLAAGTAASLGLPALAATWPSRPWRIVVPFPPGGTSDVIARLIGKPLGDALNTTVAVENKTGANGALGAAAVAQATDEHSMLLSDMSSLAINASVTKELPYKPRQLAGATMLACSPHLLCTHPNIAANNLRELAALSQTKPLNIASSGIGSANHLGAAEIALAMRMKFVHVPFRGGAQSIADVAAGNTQLVLNGMLATLPLVQGGRLKLIGISKRTRTALLPDAPTIADQGVKDFESGTYQGVAIAASMNKANAAKLSAALVQVIRMPDIRAKLVGAGAEVMTSTPKETSDSLAREGQRCGALVQSAGARLEAFARALFVSAGMDDDKAATGRPPARAHRRDGPAHAWPGDGAAVPGRCREGPLERGRRGRHGRARRTRSDQGHRRHRRLRWPPPARAVAGGTRHRAGDATRRRARPRRGGHPPQPPHRLPGRAREAGGRPRFHRAHRQLDPAFFAGRDAFLEQTEHLGERCRANRPIDPKRPVRLPGHQAAAGIAQAARRGLRYDAATCSALNQWAARLGVDSPLACTHEGRPRWP